MAFRVISWSDNEDTSAIGWLVVDRLINGVSGGGLFMHADASLREVEDLARTMTYKNTLQNPQFGGGKAGICFDHTDPRASGVLRRFIIANKEIIEECWSTGADLNTDNAFIHKVIKEDCGLTSGFASLGKMVERKCGVQDQSGKISERIAHGASRFFSLGESATGYTVSESIRYVCGNYPRVMIQGFGAVGRSLAYFLQQKQIACVVGISDMDGFIFSPDGINIDEILEAKYASGNSSPGILSFLSDKQRRFYNAVQRDGSLSDSEFLRQFLSAIHADVFSPCAVRYTIDEAVANTLITQTFNHGTVEQGFIVSGANNVLSWDNADRILEDNGICFLPEWVSNCGNGLLFLESLKLERESDSWAYDVLRISAERVREFIEKAMEDCRGDQKKLGQSCVKIAERRLEAASALEMSNEQN